MFLRAGLGRTLLQPRFAYSGSMARVNVRRILLTQRVAS